MLVIVKNRNIGSFFEFTLNFKAARRGNIFQIHAAERARQKRNAVDNFIDIFRAHAKRNGVYPAEFFKQDTFALHNGHARFGSDVAEPQNGGTVGHHGNRIPAARQLVGFGNILLNLQTWLGNTGCVSQRQRLFIICLGAGFDFDFPFPLVMQL